jgi:hypothetical protein
MPSRLITCELEGQKGWQAEGSETCYVGPDAREKARAQVQAINISTAIKKGESWTKRIKKPDDEQ